MCSNQQISLVSYTPSEQCICCLPLAHVGIASTEMTPNVAQVSLRANIIILQTKNEPRCEETGLRGFRPGPTQNGLYSHSLKMTRGFEFQI